MILKENLKTEKQTVQAMIDGNDVPSDSCLLHYCYIMIPIYKPHA
jgi:hypothetical protein